MLSGSVEAQLSGERERQLKLRLSKTQWLEGHGAGRSLIGGGEGGCPLAAGADPAFRQD